MNTLRGVSNNDAGQGGHLDENSKNEEEEENSSEKRCF